MMPSARASLLISTLGLVLFLAGATPAQPQLVLDIQPGPLSGHPQYFETLFGRLYFNADDGVTGRELWVSDGTSAGTQQFLDIIPGSLWGNPYDLTRAGDRLYFLAQDVAGTEWLWECNGTLAGTMQITPLTATWFTEFRGELYFRQQTGPTTYALAKFDRTSRTVVQIGPPATQLTVVEDCLYFVSAARFVPETLWKSDGTAAGTVQVAQIHPTNSRIGELTAVGSTLFFSADDGVAGSELWKSDGTSAGTVLVVDIDPGIRSSSPQALTAVGDKLFFRASDQIHGSEPWASDGTTAGTILLADIEPGPIGSRVGSNDWPALDGVALFTAKDALYGFELWVSDLTPAGTVLLKDINPGGQASSPVRAGLIAGKEVWFSAWDGLPILDSQIWKTDGTTAGTVKVGTVPGSRSTSEEYTLVSGRTVFRGHGTEGSELWVADIGPNIELIGTGCGNGSRVPSLDATDPVLGGVMRVTGEDAFVGSTGILLLGLPLPIAVPVRGCSLYLWPGSLASLSTFPVTTSSWFVDVPLPNIPALNNVLVALQAIYGGTDSATGFDFTNGLYANLGQ